MNELSNEIKDGAGSMKWMGILTIIFGILRLIWAFKAGSLGKGIVVFLIGVLTLLAGFWIITEPFIAAGALTIVLAIYFFADGLVEFIAAFTVEEGKGWLLFDSVVTVILGVMLFMGFPFSGPLAVGVLLGVKLLLAGIMMLTLGSAVKRVL